MLRKVCAVFLLLCLLAGMAAAEETAEKDPATPTDLDCAHVHTKTVIYFNDGPLYTPISFTAHKVSGLATIAVVCQDCGKRLSASSSQNAEEIRPHRFKKGVCALCGYRERNVLVGSDHDLPGERTFYATEDGDTQGLLTLTLSGVDLLALENANIDTVLVRSVDGEAAIALEVPEIRAQTVMYQADVCTELADREDGSFFAEVNLLTEEREEIPPEEGVSVRFYQGETEDVRMALAPADRDVLLDTEGKWDEHGFWHVDYIEEGTYFLLED